jgi:hypothetical protein
MKKKKLANSIVEAGKLLKKVPFLVVLTVIGAYSGYLFVRIISKMDRSVFKDLFLMAFLFLIGTLFISLFIQTIILGLGELLIWVGNHRVKKYPAKLEFSVRSDGKEYYLVIKNCERWLKAKNVYIEWNYFAATVDVSHEVDRKFTPWKTKNEVLRAESSKSSKKKNSIEITRKRVGEILLFQEYEGSNEFCIIDMLNEPLFCSKGGYVFVLHIHLNIPRRFEWLTVKIDLEFAPGEGLKIKSIKAEN